MLSPRYPRAPAKPPKSPMALPPESVPAWIHPQGRKYLKQRGLTEEESKCYNLHFCDGGYWSQRIIIPMYEKDALVALQGRDVTGSDPTRYRTEGPRPLYRPPWPPGDNFSSLVIVEGPFDAFAVLRAFPAVATLGNTPSSSQVSSIKQLCQTHAFTRVLVWYDSEAIGEACALQLHLTPHIPTHVIIDEHRKDPGEYLCLDPAENVGHVITSQLGTQ